MAEPVLPNPLHVDPAEQAGPANDQQWAAQTHRVSDAFCPDRMFQTAEKARPTQHDIPQLDGQCDDILWSCRCCGYEKFFDTEEILQQHHDHGHMLTYEECNICYPWHVWM